MADNPSQNPKGTQHKCKAPPEGKTGRNLIACIDGTSNQFGEKNTNVIKLYSQLVKDDGTQLTYYNSGITCSQLNTASPRNFEKIVISVYWWLADNYQDGNKIYLFSEDFHVALINAYELYADPRSDGTTPLSGHFSRPWKRRSSLLKEPIEEAHQLEDSSPKLKGSEGTPVPKDKGFLNLESFKIPQEITMVLITIRAPELGKTFQGYLLEKRRMSAFYWSLGYSLFHWDSCGGVIVNEKLSENPLQCPLHSDPPALIPDTPSENHTLLKKRQQ
ncbi:hypothetical protein BU17DRAFT_63513 [Hysterangium stoloniferum]|nr:hypothetical protein BU17DRAFT_63513 [Hysterangium stoloniferum]